MHFAFTRAAIEKRKVEGVADDFSRELASNSTLADEGSLQAFVGAFTRLAEGSPGKPQPAEGGSYAGPFSAEDAWLDLSRPAKEVHNLTRAWSFVGLHTGERGPLVELDGVCLRVYYTTLAEPAGPAKRLDCGDGPLWVVASEQVRDLSTANGPRQLARAA